MEKYQLRWKSFVNNLTNTFHDLRADNDFCDVTLVGDDRALVPAHRLVLLSSSEYFKNILKQKQSNSQLVLCLEGVSFNEINNMLDYIYNGEVQISNESLGKFLRIAQRFKLEGLIQNSDMNDQGTIENLSQSQRAGTIETNNCVNVNQSTHIQRGELTEGDPMTNSLQHFNEVKFETNRVNLSTLLYENLEEQDQMTCENEDTLCTPPEQIETNERKYNKEMGLGKDVQFSSDVFESIVAFDEKINSSFVKTGNLFSCNLCDFTHHISKTRMKQHAEIHMKGEHFSCMVCGKRFRTRESARLHVYRIHTEK